jgi:hypothetical protein
MLDQDRMQLRNFDGDYPDLVLNYCRPKRVTGPRVIVVICLGLITVTMLT